MTPSEALTVKPGDVLVAIRKNAIIEHGNEFVVDYLSRYTTGMMQDTRATLVSLVNGKVVSAPLEDFVFADVTNSFRTSQLWRDYIKLKYTPSVDALLEWINDLLERIKVTKSKFEKDFYRNEIEACKVLLDINNGFKDKYGIDV